MKPRVCIGLANSNGWINLIMMKRLKGLTRVSLRGFQTLHGPARWPVASPIVVPEKSTFNTHNPKSYLSPSLFFQRPYSSVPLDSLDANKSTTLQSNSSGEKLAAKNENEGEKKLMEENQIKSDIGTASTTEINNTINNTSNDTPESSQSSQSSQSDSSTSIEVSIPDPDDKFQSQRYYHYFDTQKIYSSLKYAGYTSDQADAVMKTIRDLLSRAISECQENSIPQWAAENEAYLFEAACSELKNEVQNARQSQAEQYRSSLARLQRDVELFGHEIDEVLNTLKVEIDMEINERKNATRAEENAIQFKIQELNNKITIKINSDIKSEIEALRWQTTRRGLMAVIFVAFILLVAISLTKKEIKPVIKRREVVTGEEIYVPILTTSEIDDIEDRKVEGLK